MARGAVTADSTAPARRSVSGSPSTGTKLATTRGLYVSISGSVVVHMIDDAAGDYRTYANHPVGYAPLQIDELHSTSVAGVILLY